MSAPDRRPRGAYPHLSYSIAPCPSGSGRVRDTHPYGEHDFGKIVHGHDTVFFKLDYYDLAMEFGSPDPSDAAVTTRVMTVMLAEEY